MDGDKVSLCLMIHLSNRVILLSFDVQINISNIKNIIIQFLYTKVIQEKIYWLQHKKPPIWVIELWEETCPSQLQQGSVLPTLPPGHRTESSHHCPRLV
jgi:hypothetical protein